VAPLDHAAARRHGIAKLATLVTEPPGVVTLIFPVVAPPGTVAVIFVAELTT
jgi:hypothetical protein